MNGIPIFKQGRIIPVGLKFKQTLANMSHFFGPDAKLHTLRHDAAEVRIPRSGMSSISQFMPEHPRM